MGKVVRRAGILGAGALLGVALGGAAVSVPAQASEFPTLTNTAVEGCLQGNPDGSVLLAHCDYTRHQEWAAYPVTGEAGGTGTTYQVQNLRTGQCLIVGPDGGLATTAACATNDSQAWLIDSRLVNQETGLCTAAQSPTEFTSVACDPTWSQDNQRWYWLQVGT